MAIVRLALSNPAANTDTLLHTATRQSIVSVIATNKSSSAATTRVWVQPATASAASQYAYITYDVQIPGNNTLETFRFALDVNDQLYVRASSANISYSLNAIYETAGTQNIFAQSSAPSSPTIGDVWVDTDTNMAYFWSGSVWIDIAPATAIYQADAPAAPNIGDVWVDSDEVPMVLNSNDFIPKAGGTFTGPVYGTFIDVSGNISVNYGLMSASVISASAGAFYGNISGILPVENDHLATKRYVDENSIGPAGSFFLGGM
jgi:hypothetical protein